MRTDAPFLSSDKQQFVASKEATQLLARAALHDWPTMELRTRSVDVLKREPFTPERLLKNANGWPHTTRGTGEGGGKNGPYGMRSER